MAEKYLVEDYGFDSLEEAQKARKELQAVQYLSQKTSGCPPEEAYKIYNKIVKENLFQTAVGYGYLHSLEEYLVQCGLAGTSDDKAVLDTTGSGEKKNAEKSAEKDAGKSAEKPEKTEKQQEEAAEIKIKKISRKVNDLERRLKKTKDRLVTSFIINVILVIGVIVMLYIASTSSNINIINYENALQDKYSSWAEELKQKEAQLKEREKAVEELEKNQ